MKKKTGVKSYLIYSASNEIFGFSIGNESIDMLPPFGKIDQSADSMAFLSSKAKFLN